ncbi:leucine--tRNA ligase [Candidatus Nanosynbacter sp. TM7-057]|uniref:leucine--tRNA ligase n=1 Tax=Candidatus Nanosynbacter sp. TM7-057 TaxID=2902630 RepID=UPI001FB61B79|nr:leucine--tRNA ligase [Candidatus Nanosynbacter sp. TM7-057]MCJ1964962.1 leucine--tRNA ligase [Candidatus Nanosynbacter sp. TM7-057]
MRRYNPTEIEQKWQNKWEDDGTYAVDFNDMTRPKYYSLSMLPGITGAGIHIGHGRTFQFADIKARFKRQQGYNVYHPIGWDSFGLPVENYAIKVGKTPRVAHDEAKVHFKEQLKRLGFSYDWTKEISTADPEYYKWTQWIFTQLYKHDLAYQKEQLQWWCETDNTVLANEQVEGGKCWRCGNPVTKRNLKQWFFRITAYADEILEATDALDWTEMVKTMQKNWIGRSVGAEVEFTISGQDSKITVFTTRPDTLFGATYIALAPEHPLISQLVNSDTREKVEAYVQASQQKSDVERQENKEKTGVFTGSYVINPVNGQKLPIWVADYVLGGYGTGAVMAVPAHDERDFAFAEKFDLPIIQVIDKPEHSADVGCYSGEGELINSGQFNGTRSEDAREQIVAWLEQQNYGRSKTTYKMRDWLISRQRYWGAPIPIVHVDGRVPIAVADECLPVILPEVENFKPTGGNTSVLAQVDDWVRVWVDVETGKTVPITENKPDGDNWAEGRRETDTLDGYACSSWYFLRYLDPHNDNEAWNPERINHWMPVDYYNGADHAVAHLLYSRFWMRFFYKLGLVPTPEPFKRMMYNAYIMAPDGQKMSKSKGNVIDPMEIMDSGYGADALRVYEMFIAPYDMDAPWDPRGVPGTYRFLNRAWNLVQEFVDKNPSDSLDANEKTVQELLRLTHLTIKKVTRDIEEEKFNTAVASMMEMVNGLYKIKESHGIDTSDEWRFALESLIQILAPFAPHITEELWHEMGHDDTVHIGHWPKWDEKYLKSSVMTIIVQVNGKLRAKLELPSDMGKQGVEAAALADENVQKFTNNKPPKKMVYVPGRLVNIVV